MPALMLWRLSSEKVINLWSEKVLSKFLVTIQWFSLQSYSGCNSGYRWTALHAGGNITWICGKVSKNYKKWVGVWEFLSVLWNCQVTAWNNDWAPGERAYRGSSGANNEAEWPGGVESTPSHPHLRFSSWRSSMFLDRDCSPLELFLVVGRGKQIFLLYSLLCSVVLVPVASFNSGWKYDVFLAACFSYVIIVLEGCLPISREFQHILGKMSSLKNDDLRSLFHPSWFFVWWNLFPLPALNALECRWVVIKSRNMLIMTVMIMSDFTFTRDGLLELKLNISWRSGCREELWSKVTHSDPSLLSFCVEKGICLEMALSVLALWRARGTVNEVCFLISAGTWRFGCSHLAL